MFFQKWSHCNGLPAQRKNTRIFQIGHIVMGYLPSGKKYEDFSGWSHYNGLPAQRKNTRIFQRKKYEDFSAEKIRGFFRLVTL